MQEEFAVLLFFFGISLTINVALGVAWFRAGRRVRRLEDRILGPGTTDDRKFERLEDAIDALAGQVEQLTNGQEFLNRVVAQRAGALADRAPDAPPAVTPH